MFLTLFPAMTRQISDPNIFLNSLIWRGKKSENKFQQSGWSWSETGSLYVSHPALNFVEAVLISDVIHQDSSWGQEIPTLRVPIVDRSQIMELIILTLLNSNTLTLSHSHTLTLSHSHTLTLSHSNTLTLSHSNTLTLSHYNIHHTHTLTL